MKSKASLFLFTMGAVMAGVWAYTKVAKYIEG